MLEVRKINGKNYNVINGELPKGWVPTKGALTQPNGIHGYQTTKVDLVEKERVQSLEMIN